MTGTRLNEHEELTNHWWGCPDCPKSQGPDDFYNAGRTHIGVCLAHRTTWIVGSNLFSSWQDETEAEQRKRYRAIESYSRVADPTVQSARSAAAGADDEQCPF